MLCTSARVVPNDDGKPNDHLIPFGLRDIRITRDAMPRPAVRVAASADSARRRSTRRRATATPTRVCRADTLVPSRPARTCDQSCSMFCIIVLTYSSHACTQFTVGVYLLFEMIDVCTLVVLLSGADLISLDYTR